MRIDEHVDRLSEEGRRLVELVAAADLGATVPTCPEWSVGELARHVGRVHRWAATYVRDGRPDAMSDDEEEAAWGAMPDDKHLVAWLAEGHAALVDVLRSAPADWDCWSFLPAPSPVAFWARRQHHETAIHRIDAAAAVCPDATDGGVPVESAVDGVDELLLAFFSRPGNRVRTTGPRTLAVVASDVNAYWLVTAGPDGCRAERTDSAPAADTEVRGPAVALYSGLWNRSALTFTGDEELARIWRERARIRWS